MNGTLPRRVTLRPRVKVRRYAHFDDPLSKAEAASFSISAGEVSRHSFLPLLGYTKVVRRMDFSDDFPALAPKPRDIRFASHTDSAIYSAYAGCLSNLYDDELIRRGLHQTVLAYRQGIGNNINFAKSLFDEIVARKDCVVICLDVSKFFDHLDHEILKERLQKLVGGPRLPADWFKIYSRLTKYEFVLKEDLEAAIGKFKRRRICEIDVFREKVRPLIKVNLTGCGIPQGTPLSGLLANLYMIELDATMNSYLKNLGGSYRRYSDDIAIVLPDNDRLDQVLCAINQLLMHHHLHINEKKTAISVVKNVVGRQTVSGDELQYLGFTFDGKDILIRSGSMRNFYSRMKSGIRRYVKGAYRKGVASDKIRKRVPVGRFTHWGDDRNFVQYAYRASAIMNSPKMKRQLRNHVRIFDRQWQKVVEKYYGA